MKIKALTSNVPSFRNVRFNEKFSIITGESREKIDSRSHNLGKTTIVKLIKFILLDGSKSFLEKIEREYPDSEFSISYEHQGHTYDFSRGFKRRKKGAAKEIDTGVDYEYFIRFQNEFDLDSPFKKASYQGEDSTWKPRLIDLLGFRGELLLKKLRLAREIKDLGTAIKSIQSAKIDSQRRQEEISKLASERDVLIGAKNSLNIVRADEMDMRIIVKDLDERIAKLKAESYSLEKEISKIDRSISSSQSLKFDFGGVEKLYAEIEVYFSGALKQDLESLRRFNDAVFSNRLTVLSEMKSDASNRLVTITAEINRIDSERASRFASIMDDDSLRKYGEIHGRLIQLERTMALLERDIVTDNIMELQNQISIKQTEHLEAASLLSREIDNNREIFSKIASLYTRIMREVMQIDARMIVEKKTTGNLDVVVRSFRDGVDTDELKGATARKISSAAVDIAIRAIQNSDSGFIIQDGIIDEVDANAAIQFVRVVKEISNEYGFQYIMTAIKDRLPEGLDPKDIVIELNDYTDKGLLFGRRY